MASAREVLPAGARNRESLKFRTNEKLEAPRFGSFMLLWPGVCIVNLERWLLGADLEERNSLCAEFPYVNPMALTRVNTSASWCCSPAYLH